MLEKFVQHRTLANLLMLIFIGIGIYALPSLQKETFPEFDSSELQVVVAYPGASAEEVEEGICQKIEDAIDGVEFIKEVESVALEGQATITIEVEDDADLTTVQTDVDTEINAIDDFPQSVEDPVITQLGLTDSVVTIAVTGPMAAGDLKDYCEDLKRRIKALAGVSLVEVQGFSDRFLRVDLDSNALRQFGLTAADVATTIGNQSVDTPAGTIETRNNDILVRFVEKRRTPQEIENIIVSGVEGAAEIRVRDVGKVIDTFEDPENMSWLGTQRAGIVQVDKTSTQDTTEVADIVRAYIEGEQLRQPQLEIKITTDSSGLIADRLYLLTSNALQGMVLVFIVMWMFFNIRISFWVVMSLPVSFLGAFFFIPLMGLTINLFTMTGLLLAIGLLMDDGIVIAENIASHLAKGKSSMAAAVDGVKEVGGGVFSSFLTTVCILGPLATIDGKIGKVLLVIPMVLILVMAVSLVEAFLMLPAHLGHSLHGHDPEKIGFLRRKINAGVDWVREKLFGSVVDFAVRWRYAVIGATIGLFIFSLSLFAAGIVGFRAFPDTEGDTLQAKILLPQGTPLYKTEAIARRICAAMDRVNDNFPDQPNDADLLETVVVSFNENSDASESGPHVATVTATILAPEDRNTSMDEVVAQWRKQSGSIADAINVTFAELSAGPAGRAIEIEFSGESLEDSKAAAQVAAKWFGRFEGVFDLSDDLRPGKQEIRMRLKSGAVGLGLNVQSMANQVQAAFQGARADDVQVGAEQFEVNVRLGPDFRDSLQDFNDFHFALSDGTQVPINTVAEIEFNQGWSRIARIDGRRTVTLIGDTDSRIVNTSDLISLFRSESLPQIQSNFPNVTVSVAGESAESAETGTSMVWAFIMGCFGIYAILSFQFQSWLEPVIVMFAIPMALIGVILGHLWFDIDICMPSLIGFVSLAGVVVNDSILLIMFLKQERENGSPPIASACSASRIRFRAIMLTSATTVAGLLPLSLETSTQAQTLIPLAIAIAFGMMAATVLILIVIPCVYVVMCDMKLIRDNAEH